MPPFTPASSLALGGEQLDYAQITAPVTCSATSEGAATTIVTGAAIVCDGVMAVLVEFYAESLQLTTSSTGGALCLYQDGASIGKLTDLGALTLNQDLPGGYFARRIVPVAGSHTFSVRGFTLTAGTLVVGAGLGGSGANMPAFLRVTRV